jgi:ribosomal protein L7/L12
MSDTGPHASTEVQLPSAAVAALRQGNKIEAIKIVRQERGIGLKEAKDAVDLYLQADPLLQSKFAAAQAGSKRSCLLWLTILVALALIGYYLFSKGLR